MAVRLDNNKKEIDMIAGDTLSFTIKTEGVVVAEIGDTATIIIKEKETDTDAEAILKKDIDVIVDNEIPIEITSAETELFAAGTYYWSVKHTKGANEYFIIPDSTSFSNSYPKIKVRGALFDD